MVDTTVLVFVAFIAYEVFRYGFAKYQAYRRACLVEAQIKHAIVIVTELYMSYFMRVLTRKTSPLDDKIRTSINALLKQEIISKTTWQSINNWLISIDENNHHDDADYDNRSIDNYNEVLPPTRLWTFTPVYNNWNDVIDADANAKADADVNEKAAHATSQESDNIEHPCEDESKPPQVEQPVLPVLPTEKPTVLEADSPEALDELISSANSLNNSLTSSQIFDGMDMVLPGPPKRRFGLKSQSQK